ncbi:MAG: hypothetical protein HRU29_09865 [Rhizobiales bacterium]|nr:hypothetical protein [Hyphomicrobiales bacterium]NRB14697.1 hypothetical protein [Hyphomicrobiales bacterium]
MRYILAIPSLVFVFAVLNYCIFMGIDLTAKLTQFDMISGQVLEVNFGDILILVGLLCLFVDILKSVRTSVGSVIEHAFSTILLIAAIVEFLMLKQAGTMVFLVITFMMLIDVVGGYSVTIGTARRDFSMVDR